MARTLVATVTKKSDFETITTDKGSLISGDGALAQILSVGVDGQALKALASEPLGLEWATLSEVPTTGTDGHFLRKTVSGSQFEAILQVPSGGTTGQILTKTASSYAWQTPSGGGMQIATTVRLNTNASYTIPSGDFAYVSGNGYRTGDVVSTGALFQIVTAGGAVTRSNNNIIIDGVTTMANNNTVIYIAVISN